MILTNIQSDQTIDKASLIQFLHITFKKISSAYII
jgi:hypothetical protein